MEDINAKLDLLALNTKERAIALEKFFVTLSFITYDNLKAIVDFFQSKGMKITKASEIKVACNDYNEIVKKFDIIDSINETALYRENIMRININALDIFKKIKYCLQVNRPYKREDGSYEPFLFSEIEWQKAFNRDSASVEVAEIPEINISSADASMDSSFTIAPSEESNDEKSILNTDSDESFAKIRSELEGLQSQLAALDNLDSLQNNSYGDEITFNDIEPEVYRRAA